MDEPPQHYTNRSVRCKGLYAEWFYINKEIAWAGIRVGTNYNKKEEFFRVYANVQNCSALMFTWL